jgi:hypothetical protein
MRPRVAILSLLIAVALAAAAGADCLVLRGGKRIDTIGPWTVRGTLIMVHDTTRRALTMTLAVIDFDATLKANAPGAKPPQPARSASQPRASAAGIAVRPTAPNAINAGSDDLAAHVDLETIKKIQEYARNQAEMEAQMRARVAANMLAQMNARSGGGGSGSQDQAQQGRGRAQGREPSAGFQATKDCAIWQDNPSAYSSCLANH